jgi:hypothetical protein
MKYLVILAKTSVDMTKNNGITIPAGSVINYHLQYPSKTEAAAHAAYVARWATPLGIMPITEPAPRASERMGYWCLPATEPALHPVMWLKCWVASCRGYRRICADLRRLKLPLLPEWPNRARAEARTYWRSSRRRDILPAIDKAEGRE